MYTTMLFTAKMIDTNTELKNNYERIKYCVFYIALGALLGWPFSGAVSLPFIVNELYLDSSSSSTTAILNSFSQMINKIKLFSWASIRALVIIMVRSYR
jgi:alpha-1,2-mannosyltransferase